MRILLVRPSVMSHTIGLKHIMICEPLELEYIAANLGEHDVQILDLLVESGLKERLETFRPDIVVSSAYKAGTNQVIKLFREVKRWCPTCITITGGVHATLVPEDLADVSTDIIGIGDGTFLLAEIVQCLEDKTPLFTVSGLAIPVGDGELVKTEARTYMPPADSLPLPRRDLIAHLRHKYYYLMHQPVATIKTAWGCWYKCNFCFTWKITDGTQYFRSPESIVRELLTIEAEDVYIVDDIFLIKPSRLRRLADLIVEHGIKKKYLVYARADFIAANEPIIAEWAQLGLSAVFIGLEAGTSSELDAMNKELDLNDNEAAVALLRKYKIDTYGSLIPSATYTREDWANLWAYIQRLGLYYVNISPATPLPGAANYGEYKGQLTVPEDAHSLFDLSHQVTATTMPLKAYYRQLLWLYARTILNIPRASKVAQRTLPSIWSWKYLRVIWGTLKIGRQFYLAHTHHSAAGIAKAQYKGEPVPGLNFDSKFDHPSFSGFVRHKKLA